MSVLEDWVSEHYKENKIVGAKLVKSFGGKILRAKILEDFSSSLVIEEISNSSF